ncbi:MAG: hypothetical protein M1820_003472 [Bogoriella megaspora]|nr:MAG: hypothetical protein M1820_003472 [Bogoriella megaspora]
MSSWSGLYSSPPTSPTQRSTYIPSQQNNGSGIIQVKISNICSAADDLVKVEIECPKQELSKMLTLVDKATYGRNEASEMAAPRSMYFYGVLDRFSEEGTRKVIEYFDELVGDRTCVCRYLDDDELFQIEAPAEDGEQVYQIFLEAFGTVVTGDFQATDNLGGPWKSRMAEAVVDVGAEWDNLDVQPENGSAAPELLIDTTPEAAVNPNASRPDADTDEPESQTWAPHNSETKLSKLVTRQIVQDLAECLHYEVRVNVDENSIAIFTTDEAALALFYQKMSNIERNSYREPTNLILIELEGQGDAGLSLMKLRSAKNSAFKRTLLPVGSTLTKNLHNMLVVRSMKYVGGRRGYEEIYVRSEALSHSSVYKLLYPEAVIAKPLGESLQQTLGLSLEMSTTTPQHGYHMPQVKTKGINTWLDALDSPVSEVPSEIVSHTPSLPPATTKFKSNKDLTGWELATHTATAPAPSPNDQTGDLLDLSSPELSLLQAPLQPNSPASLPPTDWSSELAVRSTVQRPSVASTKSGRKSIATSSMPRTYEETKFNTFAWERKPATPTVKTGTLFDFSNAAKTTTTPRVPPGLELAATSRTGVIKHESGKSNWQSLTGPPQSTVFENMAPLHVNRQNLKAEDNKAMSLIDNTTEAKPAAPQMQPSYAVRHTPRVSQNHRPVKRDSGNPFDLLGDNDGDDEKDVPSEPMVEDRYAPLRRLQPARPEASPPARPNETEEPRIAQFTEVRSRKFFRTNNKRAPSMRSAGQASKNQGRRRQMIADLWEVPRLQPAPLQPSKCREARAEGSVDLHKEQPAQDPKLQNAYETAKTILEHSRAFRGKLILEVQIAQNLLSVANSKARDFENDTHGVREIETFLAEQIRDQNAREFATTMLTASAHDVEYLIGVKNATKARAFATMPYISELTYEFVCESAKIGKFTAMVDIDGRSETKGPVDIVGSVSWHHVLRMYDARFIVAGEKTILEPQDEGLNKLLSSLRVHVPEGKILPDIQVEISNKEFAVHSVMIKRRFYYQSLEFKNIALKVTETSDLFIYRNTQTGALHASAKEPAEMVAESRQWYEASLVPMAMPKVFAENENLRIGDDAAWKPDDVMSFEEFQDFKDLATEMVKKMDNVGFNNQGPRGSREETDQWTQQWYSNQPAESFW